FGHCRVSQAIAMPIRQEDLARYTVSKDHQLAKELLPTDFSGHVVQGLERFLFLRSDVPDPAHHWSKGPNLVVIAVKQQIGECHVRVLRWVDRRNLNPEDVSSFTADSFPGARGRPVAVHRWANRPDRRGILIARPASFLTHCRQLSLTNRPPLR